MNQPFRHATAGRIDRGRQLRFSFNGIDMTGFGDTLASALLANGVHEVARSVNLGRPRGIFSAGSEEPSAVVQIESPYAEPMLTATTVELHDGLVASSLSGRGRLADGPDTARYDGLWAHCDVLIIGAGPAGLAAALGAAQPGVRVILADERPIPGGSLLDSSPTVNGTAVERLNASPDVRVLTRTAIVGYYDDNFVVGVERRTNHLGFAAPAHRARERLWRIRAGRVVLATGAHERPIPFPDNDRPGVMLASAARAYLHRFGVLAGTRALVHTTNDSAYDAAVDLSGAGVEVVAIADLRGKPGAAAGRRVTEAGIKVLPDTRVIGIRGERRITGVTVAGQDVGIRELDVDLVLVSGGWSPVVHLYGQAGGRLRFDDELGAFVPDGCRQRVEVVGAAAGEGLPRDGALPDVLADLTTDSGRRFVDLQRDVTVADVLQATGVGLRSVEHVKRYTTAGTAHDQGKTSGLLTSATVARALGSNVSSVGVTTFRPPYTPVAFATLAGRDRGELFDPVRVTPMHDWHVAHGALFEVVGQWKRAWYYPRDGEDIDDAVARECRAARRGVALMDVSTLGKIDVQGPDAAEFLDRLYTNMISTLRVGAVRYGVTCGLDGMILDDGTVARLAADRFVVTTTTGNAALILDWMEEWLQTEWPQLRVWCTSVTEQWATVALVGPGSRDVLSRVAPELGVEAASFPFMTWRDCVVADLSARVFRISFSGELAYEVNVAAWDGLALWTALVDAGAAAGITPYGTETMHVLRAEKGYPIIGQDTDGTVTPQDLGLGWAVSKSKVDFVGRRSFRRSDTSRTDRKHLVGLLPEDPSFRLPEGAHLVDVAELPPPVPYLGHVTSSYRSEALGRTFALALIASGRDREGQRLFAPLDGAMVPVTVASPLLYDPEGARRDG